MRAPALPTKSMNVRKPRLPADGMPAGLGCKRLNTEGPALGFLGEERVNVLELNLALAQAA